jgi:BlaI family transcriptional regulator, penicillinase repressor
MRTSPRLTGPQLAILKVLWARGEATVPEVQKAISAERPSALTTIATQLSRLAKRGIVAYRVEGRQYIYRALVSEAAARAQALGELTEHHFEGDIATLVSQLLSSRDIRRGDLTRVKALIEAKERELKGTRS